LTGHRSIIPELAQPAEPSLDGRWKTPSLDSTAWSERR
jgi:hypothetical protein